MAIVRGLFGGFLTAANLIPGLNLISIPVSILSLTAVDMLLEQQYMNAHYATDLDWIVEYGKRVIISAVVTLTAGFAVKGINNLVKSVIAPHLKEYGRKIATEGYNAAVDAARRDPAIRKAVAAWIGVKVAQPHVEREITNTITDWLKVLNVGVKIRSNASRGV